MNSNQIKDFYQCVQDLLLQINKPWHLEVCEAFEAQFLKLDTSNSFKHM